MREDGYDDIARYIDLLIYIDCPVDLAKRRRFRREDEIRSRAAEGTPKGLSEDHLSAFWSEVLEPGISAWVLPIRRYADLTIELDQAGAITNATLVRSISKDSR
jgi:uridine kinase